MSTSKPPARIKRFVAEAAIAQSHRLPRADRPALFTYVATMLEGEEAEQAKLVAFSLCEGDRHQLKLEQLLKEAAR